ncbi:MAG: PDZ domain-containing protein [Xanthomonadales bacterium]|nr:PDZ domain-containing protein [Xanthomonadales bacterium]
MDKVKQQLGVDPAELANQITPMPVMEDGKFVGVRLNGGQHAAALNQLGLQPEDIVTAVNGVSVTDPSRIGPAISALSTAARIEVTVRRNGKPQTLTVDIPR